jgi:hypothetical protein
MDNFERLIQRCELLKTRIKELQFQEVDEYQESIRKIQLEMLKAHLSEVGRQLNRLTLYKRDEND